MSALREWVKEAPGFQGRLAVLKVTLVAVASCVE
jgi:hypothetical protein